MVTWIAAVKQEFSPPLLLREVTAVLRASLIETCIYFIYSCNIYSSRHCFDCNENSWGGMKNVKHFSSWWERCLFVQLLIRHPESVWKHLRWVSTKLRLGYICHWNWANQNCNSVFQDLFTLSSFSWSWPGSCSESCRFHESSLIFFWVPLVGFSLSSPMVHLYCPET